MQPACADFAEGLGGVGSLSGKDRREIPVFFTSGGVGGKIRARGRDQEEFFVTDVSDPDDTPEDVDDDDEPEFCRSISQSINHQSSIINHQSTINHQSIKQSINQVVVSLRSRAPSRLTITT